MRPGGCSLKRLMHRTDPGRVAVESKFIPHCRKAERTAPNSRSVECSFSLLQILSQFGGESVPAQNHVLSACHLVRVDQFGRPTSVNARLKSHKPVNDSVLILNHSILGPM